MTDGINLATAVISAIATLIGTYVSVAQWRASKGRPGTGSTRSTSRGPGTARDPLRRRAAWAAGFGAVASALFALTFVLSQAGEERDSVLLPIFLICTAATLTAIVLALWVLAAALFRTRWPVAGAALAALILATWPWMLLYAFGS